MLSIVSPKYKLLITKGEKGGGVEFASNLGRYNLIIMPSLLEGQGV